MRPLRYGLDASSWADTLFALVARFVMHVDYLAPAEAVRLRGGPLRATNVYGDLMYWFLFARDMESAWKPTVNAAAPRVVFTLPARFLDSGFCVLRLSHEGAVRGQLLWRLSVETEMPMQAMGDSDRRTLDAFYAHLCEYRRLTSLLDECNVVINAA